MFSYFQLMQETFLRICHAWLLKAILHFFSDRHIFILNAPHFWVNAMLDLFVSALSRVGDVKHTKNKKWKIHAHNEIWTHNLSIDTHLCLYLATKNVDKVYSKVMFKHIFYKYKYNTHTHHIECVRQIHVTLFKQLKYRYISYFLQFLVSSNLSECVLELYVTCNDIEVIYMWRHRYTGGPKT